MNEHGLHSPFLFDLYNSCFKPRFSHKFNTISGIKEILSSSSEEIQISDFGAGSQVTSSSIRKVRDMYKNSSISKKQGELFNRLIKYFQAENVIELGTHLGLSSAYLSLGTDARVISIEGCPETAQFAQNIHLSHDLKNIEIVNRRFEEALPGLLESLSSIDCVYLDGNHSYEPTLAYYEMLKPKLNEQSFLIFDDINWSEDMKRAWEDIIKDDNISISLNCYKFGIVFFRGGIEKQNFYLMF